jgi:hypothetical protein
MAPLIKAERQLKNPVISDVILPGSESYTKVQRALSFMLQVSDIADATISEDQKSYDLFRNAQEEIEPIRRKFHVSTDKHFADLSGNFGRSENLAYTLNYDKEPYPEYIENCNKGSRPEIHLYYQSISRLKMA